MRRFIRILIFTITTMVMLLIAQMALVYFDISIPFREIFQGTQKQRDVMNNNKSTTGVMGNELKNQGNSLLPQNTSNHNEEVNSSEEKAETGQRNAEPVNDNEYYISGKEAEAIEKISIADKIKGLQILSKLKEADIQRVLNIVRDGVTFKELRDIDGILKDNLNPQDIECLNEILERNKKLYESEKK